jgi:hypothetical protein
MTPKIEDKPIYCSAWVSKINDHVMCNTIPCCGFCLDGRKIGEKYKSLSGKPLHEVEGKHPLINGKFVWDDGEVHKA